jgi:hypothetical protein
MKLLRVFTTILLTMLTMSACTLMDNDLRDLPDDVLGYKEIVHEETDEYTADYQYQPWTKILDERYMPYIHSIDFENYTLYFYDFIPDDMLPREGDCLAAKPCEKIKWGLSHKVLSVRREGYYYAVDMVSAKLDEVFKHLVYNQEAEYVLEPEGGSVSKNDSTRSLAWTRMTEPITRADEPKDPNDPTYLWELSKPAPITFDLVPTLINTVAALALKKDNFDAETFKQLVGLNASAFIATNLPGVGTVHDVHIDVNNGKSWHIKIDAEVQLEVKVTPILKTKNFIDIDNDRIDIWAEVGGIIEITTGIGGTLTLNLDLWKLLGLPQPKPVLVGAPIGVPLWFETVYGLDLNASFAGSFNYKYKKEFSSTVGFKYGVDGDNGPWAKKNDPKGTFHKNGLWPYQYNRELAFNAGLTFSIAPTITLGVPKNADEVQWMEEAKKMLNDLKMPRLYLQYKPSIGIEYSLKTISDQITHGDVVHGLYLPLKFADLNLVLDVTDHLSFDWNIGKAIAEAFGGKTELKIPLGEWRWYPSVDNLCVACLNPTQTGKTPEFQVDFDINDLGLQVDGTHTARPVLSIIPEGTSSTSALVKYDDFGFLSLSSKGKHFSKIIKSDKLKRDVSYQAMIEFVEPKEDGSYGSLYYKTYSFSSLSPSACIAGDTITYQAGHFKQITPDKDMGIGKPRYSDWTFRTLVQLMGYKDIDELGFYVGKKKYRVEGKPASPSVLVIWNLKKQKEARKFSIRPYVKVGEVENIWPSPYNMELNFGKRYQWNDPNFGGNKPYKGSPYGEFYVFGYDHEGDFKSDNDMTLTDSFKSRRKYDPQTEDEGVAIYEIEITDDAFDDSDSSDNPT